MRTGRTYFYRAMLASGALHRGEVTAGSREEATAELVRRGLHPLLLRQGSREEGPRTLAAAEAALGLRALATLLESGMPVGAALHAMRDVTSVRWQPLVTELEQAVREGRSLANAFAGAATVLPPTAIGVLRAGEAAGRLAAAAARAADVLERQAERSRAIRSALAYPAVLATAGVLSVAILTGIVLPRFATILTDLGESMPATTRFVLATADLTRRGAMPGLGAAVLGLMAMRIWLASPAGRLQWHMQILRLPLYGPIRRSSATGHVAGALAALLESGVPLVPAMKHAAAASGDLAMARKVEAASLAIAAGTPVAEALSDADAFTPTAVRLVRAGTASGRLAAMLLHVSALEHDRAEQRIRSVVRLIEPVMVLVFGMIVAFVAAALLQAVYAINPLT